MEMFEIMIEVVSFDFFQITEYVDLGMTETDPWSPNFEILCYETVNFIEGMGSILLTGLFIAITGLITMILFICKCKTSCKIVGKMF